jgi:predicted amidohydrolase YtcJ
MPRVGSERENAARLFFNAKVATLDPSNSFARVIASEGQRIVYVGDDLRAALKSFKGPVEEIDLKGRTVIPGLFDSHTHFLPEGVRLSQTDVFGLSFEETLSAVKRKLEELPPGAWLHGRGWDQNLFPGRQWPKKEDLDKVSPLNPVVLDRVDKHSVWFNSEALRRSGINKDTSCPGGGEILKNDKGEPLGVLVGKAMFLLFGKMPLLDGLDPFKTLKASENEFLSFGITTAIDCGTRKNDFLWLKDAYREKKLKIRYHAYVIPDPWEEELLKEGPRRGLFGDRLFLDGVKLFSDGSLGSQSAWLKEEYSDREGHYGGHNYEDKELFNLMKKVKDRNLQVAIHVIGDAAVEQAVRIMEKVLGKEAPKRRWRLEHFQVVSPETMKKTLSLGLIPSIQSVGLMTDLHMVSYRLGEKRLPNTYSWRKIIEGGSYLINGSDAPIETPNPFHGIYAAVSRRDLKGFPEGGYRPEDALSLYEALLSYTKWPAEAAFQENDLGTLVPGKLCDFVVLDRDIFSIGLREIADIKPLLTVVGGETAYMAEDF